MPDTNETKKAQTTPVPSDKAAAKAEKPAEKSVTKATPKAEVKADKSEKPAKAKAPAKTEGKAPVKATSAAKEKTKAPAKAVASKSKKAAANGGKGVRAQAKYIRVAPRKARLVVDLIRNKSVNQANEILQFSTRAVATDVEKVLRSACANAFQNNGLRTEDLVISEAYVDEGPTLKRIRPRAKGSASRINKRTSHITVVVAPRKEAKA